MTVPSFFFTLFFFLCVTSGNAVFAQQKEDSIIIHTYKKDSLGVKQEDTALIQKEGTVISESKIAKKSHSKSISKDSSIEKRFNPKVALFRSAVLPGWGQWYNKKYWKIPIIYGALGITAYVFFYNLNTYKLLRQAVIYRNEGYDSLVAPELQDLPTSYLILNRDSFRQNIDYSVLVFLGFWVLNIVDADVDANLKAFNVSPDIGMRIHPGFNFATNSPGISLVFFFKEKSNQPKLPLP